MNRLLDKVVLFALCLCAYLVHQNGMYAVVPVIIAALFGALCSVFDKNALKFGLLGAYVAACFFLPSLVYFLPLLCYDRPRDSRASEGYLALSAVPIISAFVRRDYGAGVFGLVLYAVGLAMSYRSESLERSKKEFEHLRDSAKESALELEAKNRELLQRQDYEIGLATLRERNRIARDIHDSVGHLLSSAILQVGALIATSPDPEQRERLGAVKDTLAGGMDSIRKSVHDLYDESVDLYAEVRGAVGSFGFCPVALDYDLDIDPGGKVKYAFIAIIKEALTNISRHSGATAASITLRGQPAFYSLIISDNGRGTDGSRLAEGTRGLGLKNIASRVEGIGGILNISGEKGFKIFISVPKGGLT